MPDNSSSQTTVHSITFYDNHLPALQDADYTIHIDQTVVVNSNKISIPEQIIKFKVEGPRFILEPSLIHSHFPPKGGHGDYRSSLPSLVLTRSTLPWERSPTTFVNENLKASWLYLLLIDESETSLVTEQNNAPLKNLQSYLVSSSNNSVPLTSDDLDRYPTNINYLEVDGSLESIIPKTLEELQYLSCVRIKEEVPPFPKEEHAVLLCNRLPKAGSTSTVYLISIENNYHADASGSQFTGITDANKKLVFPYLYKWQFHAFDDKLYSVNEAKETIINSSLPATTPTRVPLDLSSLYDVLYPNTSSFNAALAALTPPITDPQILPIIHSIAQLPGGTFHGMLSNLPGGFGPFTLNPSAQSLACSGSVQVPYLQIKESAEGLDRNPTQAWYRGPLAASAINVNSQTNFPDLSRKITVNTSIQLIAKAENGSWSSSNTSIASVQNGMVTGVAVGSCTVSYTIDTQVQTFNITVSANALNSLAQSPSVLVLNDKINNIQDTSYAAAFELGRLSALGDADFSKEFFTWKSQTAKALRLQALSSNPNYKNVANLPLAQIPEAKPMPQHVVDKFYSWMNLENIPYRYLIPADELLPDESIRFFQLDKNWINSFICGAFSIGHTVKADLTPYVKGLFLADDTPVTGFLINSMVVSAWPDFMVDAHSMDDSELTLLRKANLNKDIRIYLISGSFKNLEFHLHPGKMHSGFMYNEGAFTKLDGNLTVNIDEKLNTIPIDELVTGLNANSIAAFSAAMLQGIPTVLFRVIANTNNIKQQ
jgi:hypothetical protein